MRFEVWQTHLEPTLGGEMRSTRPCLVISPDEANQEIGTVIIVPMTTGGHPYRSRVACSFGGRNGHIVLDQIRVIDKMRLIKRLGKLDKPVQLRVLDGLAEMFAP